MNNMNYNYHPQHHRNYDHDPRVGIRAGRPRSKGYVQTSQLICDTGATEQTLMTTLPEDDEHVLSNNSIQPAWRSNYKSDSTERMSISTSDLISWAFQVSRGMDYLSKKKVLHGDLAARNILLCEDNVVKICDFGLARSMYRCDNYKKTSDARLPIKWLALESLGDHVFSTYTDIWSFGVVLWEFFSLAKVPYPGIDPNQDLYMKLKDGYRMEKPPYANDDLHDIMLECWSTNPERRPLFSNLEKRFANMLDDDKINHYVDLNEPYLKMNAESSERQKTDYLSLMGSPDEIAPEPPCLNNYDSIPETWINMSSDEFLQVSTDSNSAKFFSARQKNSCISNSEESNTKTNTYAEHLPPTYINAKDYSVEKQFKMEDENGVALTPEEIPMLQNEVSNLVEQISDQNKLLNLLKQKKKKSNYSQGRNVEAQKISDSYVNVKPPRSTFTTKGNRDEIGSQPSDAFSNPGYQSVKM